MSSTNPNSKNDAKKNNLQIFSKEKSEELGKEIINLYLEVKNNPALKYKYNNSDADFYYKISSEHIIITKKFIDSIYSYMYTSKTNFYLPYIKALDLFAFMLNEYLSEKVDDKLKNSIPAEFLIKYLEVFENEKCYYTLIFEEFSKLFREKENIVNIDEYINRLNDLKNILIKLYNFTSKTTKESFISLLKDDSVYIKFNENPKRESIFISILLSEITCLNEKTQIVTTSLDGIEEIKSENIAINIKINGDFITINICDFDEKKKSFKKILYAKIEKNDFLNVEVNCIELLSGISAKINKIYVAQNLDRKNKKDKVDLSNSFCDILSEDNLININNYNENLQGNRYLVSSNSNKNNKVKQDFFCIFISLHTEIYKPNNYNFFIEIFGIKVLFPIFLMCFHLKKKYAEKHEALNTTLIELIIISISVLNNNDIAEDDVEILSFFLFLMEDSYKEKCLIKFVMNLRDSKKQIKDKLLNKSAEYFMKNFNAIQYKFRKIINGLFIFNSPWSDKKLFFHNKNCFKYKQKMYNYHTKNFQKFLLYPVLDYQFNHPTFKTINNDKINDVLFTEDNYYLYNFSLEFLYNDLVNKNNMLNDDIVNLDNNILCYKVKINYNIPGFMNITPDTITFTSIELESYRKLCKENSSFERGVLTYPDRKIGVQTKIILQNIQYIFKRIYYYHETGLEIFDSNLKSYYFVMQNESDYKKLLKILQKNLSLNSIYSSNNVLLGYYNKNLVKFPSKLDDLYKKWANNELSNFDFLSVLNALANRSFNDIHQYPVFPVLFFYTKEQQEVHRDLGYPVGLNNLEENKNKRIKMFFDTYKMSKTLGNDLDNDTSFFTTHYSNGVYTSNYLIRLLPFAYLAAELQGGGFDDPNRLFQSVPFAFNNIACQQTDVRELIPEFFCLPEMLLNENDIKFKCENDDLSIVKMPKNSEDEVFQSYMFIIYMIEKLESSKSIEKWLNLIFGVEQKKFLKRRKGSINESTQTSKNKENKRQSNLIELRKDEEIKKYKQEERDKNLKEIKGEKEILDEKEEEQGEYVLNFEENKLGNNKPLEKKEEKKEENISESSIISSPSKNIITKEHSEVENSPKKYYTPIKSSQDNCIISSNEKKNTSNSSDKNMPHIFEQTPNPNKIIGLSEEAETLFDYSEIENFYTEQQYIKYNNPKNKLYLDDPIKKQAYEFGICPLQIFSNYLEKNTKAKKESYQDLISKNITNKLKEEKDIMIDYNLNDLSTMFNIQINNKIYEFKGKNNGILEIAIKDKKTSKYIFYDHDSSIIFMHFNRNLQMFCTTGKDSLINIYILKNPPKLIRSIKHPLNKYFYGCFLSSKPLPMIIGFDDDKFYFYTINGTYMYSITMKDEIKYDKDADFNVQKYCNVFFLENVTNFQDFILIKNTVEGEVNYKPMALPFLKKYVKFKVTKAMSGYYKSIY